MIGNTLIIIAVLLGITWAITIAYKVAKDDKEQ